MTEKLKTVLQRIAKGEQIKLSKMLAKELMKLLEKYGLVINTGNDYVLTLKAEEFVRGSFDPKFEGDDAKAMELILKEVKNIEKAHKKVKDVSISKSFLENDGTIYEEVYDPETKSCRFAVWDGEKVDYVSDIQADGAGSVVPINDDALATGAVLLPSEAEEYEDLTSLVHEIQDHLHKYVDISPDFEIFSSYYILLSWVSDKIGTLPYLRVLGDTGTGKSRFLNVVGRLCYKACLVSGAITPAPIYRMIRRWGGSIVLDEADFKDSSEKSEVVTILNCGFERDRPVIRCVKDKPDELEFLPTFGPKVLSTRYTFKDKALESRCLTEMLRQTDRKDIPAILPPEFYIEEQKLRNKLLMFRFRYRDKIDSNDIQKIDLGNVEPRLKQATSSFAVLFSNIDGLMKKFKEFLVKYNKELVEERSTTFEGMIVNAILLLKECERERITPSDIAEKISEEYEIDKPVPQTIGKYLKSLGLSTKAMKVDGSTKRVLVWDEKLMNVLRRRYDPNGVHVTAVTNVTAVTEQEKVTGVTSVTALRETGESK